MTPQEVLVVRMDAIGDTLLSLPALHALHRRWPDARISVVVSRSAVGVVQPDPAIHQAIVPHDIKRFQPPAADVAIAFTEKPWAYRWLKASGAATRIGFWSGATQPVKSLLLHGTLTHPLHLPNDLKRNNGLHEVERYVRLLEPLDVASAVPPLRIHIPEEAHRVAAGWLAERSLESFVVLHLNEKWSRGGWDGVELLRRLARQIPNVLLTYGPAEASWAHQVAAPHAFSHPDLKVFAALVARARAVVTMDTSAAHLAAAVDVPVVDIFPPDHFEHCTTRWRPWGVPYHLVKRPPLPSPDRFERAAAPLLQEIAAALERIGRTPCPSASV